MVCQAQRCKGEVERENGPFINLNVLVLCFLRLDYVMPDDDSGLHNSSSHLAKRLQDPNSLRL